MREADCKGSLRRPGDVHRDYLNQLVIWGYTPSEVEAIIIGTAG